MQNTLSDIFCLNTTNQWQYLKYIADINIVGKLGFSPDIIGMLRFIKYFKHRYPKMDNIKFEFHNSHFVIFVKYSSGFIIEIVYILKSCGLGENGSPHWYICASVLNKSSNGRYNDTNIVYTNKSVHETYNFTLNKIRRLSMIALMGGV